MMRGAAVQTDPAELAEYRRQVAAGETEVGGLECLVGELRDQKQAAIEQAALALLEGRPFDIAIFAELDGRLLQADRGREIAAHRLEMAKRNEPAKIYDIPPRRTN